MNYPFFLFHGTGGGGGFGPSGPKNKKTKLKLYYFFNEVKQDIERFRSYWNLNSSESCPYYPEKLNYYEWFEQFFLFLKSSEYNGTKKRVKED